MSRKRCDHKFVDSTRCLKCGWQPPLSHEERQRLIRAPITRGILATTRVAAAHGAGGFSADDPTMAAQVGGGRWRYPVGRGQE